MSYVNWGTVLGITLTVLIVWGAIVGGNMVSEQRVDKWDTIIARCHDVPGRDYDGCLNKGNLEWNRGGKP